MRDDEPEVSQLTWPGVWARRLERHALAVPAAGIGPADVARAICGVHAQVMSAAELSIGLRLARISLQHVRDALWIEKRLIKTYGPRGTVHLLAADDLAVWCGALSAIPAGASALAEGVRLSPEREGEIVAAIDDALADAELTVDELTEALIHRCGAWAGERVMPAFGERWPRWRQATALAANRGALCFGPSRGRAVTYTNPHRWLPDFRPMDGQAALAELVTRYLHAYGPATPQQFAQWLAAPRGWAAALFDSLAGELAPVDVEGVRAWVAARDTAVPAAPPRGVRLLPYFDAYVVGCHPRGQLFPGRAATRALANGQAGVFPVLLLDGVVGGVWHLRRSGRRLVITVEPLAELTPAQRDELDAQVARIGAFLEGTPQVTIGPVSVGAHA